ncbi:MAG TPA: hypothetical protein VH797_07215 [Nitrososphaeraceae archaeon]
MKLRLMWWRVVHKKLYVRMAIGTPLNIDFSPQQRWAIVREILDFLFNG